ncbi:MAG: helix-turn-helix domain-containing protein [Anaerolineae bacterium]
MDERANAELRRRILEEMTVDYSSTLDKNFNLAKQYLRITSEGKVDVMVKDDVTGAEKVLLYLIGKLYAKEAELSGTAEVSNAELMEELGMPKGSVLPAMKDLRDSNMVEQTRGGRLAYHSVRVSVVERSLRMIDKKLKKGARGG